MKHIVLTGGSRGIGRGLALEFLRNGCMVTISGRDSNRIQSTVEELKSASGSTRCQGIKCDVTRLNELELLWKDSSSIRPVDIWINNAGIIHANHNFLELNEIEIESVIQTNVTGTVLGAKVALKGMVAQGFGALYNMEGFGSDGRVMAGMSIYGTSKSAIRYFTRSLIKEFRNTPVLVGSISPGMVITDMILKPLQIDPGKNRDALKIFHILADTPQKVTPWIVDQILRNKRHGRHIAWLTPVKISQRFLLNMFYKRKVEGLPAF